MDFSILQWIFDNVRINASTCCFTGHDIGLSWPSQVPGGRPSTVLSSPPSSAPPTSSPPASQLIYKCEPPSPLHNFARVSADPGSPHPSCQPHTSGALQKIGASAPISPPHHQLPHGAICPALLRRGFKNRRHGTFPWRGGGVPPFSVNFFPLGFREPPVRGGGGGTPPFR